MCNLPIWHKSLWTCQASIETSKLRKHPSTTSSEVCKSFGSDMSHQGQAKSNLSLKHLDSGQLHRNSAEDNETVEWIAVESWRWDILPYSRRACYLACAQCAACNWSSPIFVRQCTIVAEKELFNAKGWLAVCMYVCSFVFMCVYHVMYVSSVCKGISALSLLISIYSVLQKMQNSKMQQWNQLSTTLQMSFGHVQLHGHLWNPSYIHAPLCSGKVCIDFTYFNPIDYISITTAFRSTIYTQYSVLKEMQLSLGNLSFPTTITYNHFRMACYCYMKQLDVDYRVL